MVGCSQQQENGAEAGIECPTDLYSDPTGEKVYVGQNIAFEEEIPCNSWFFHSALILAPDDPKEFENMKFNGNSLFVRANDGTLYVSVTAAYREAVEDVGVPATYGLVGLGLNATGNRMEDLERTLVSTPGGMDDSEFIKQILAAVDALAKKTYVYEPFPREHMMFYDNQTVIRWHTYNCNSVTSGLLKAVGANPPYLPHISPGYDEPIPVW